MFKTKKAFIKALMKGRTFDLIGKQGKNFHYDNSLNKPFRYGDNDIGDGLLYYNRGLLIETTKHWYNEIPRKGVWCWVDITQDQPNDPDALYLITGYDNRKGQFMTETGRWFKNAQPLKKKELKRIFVK